LGTGVKLHPAIVPVIVFNISEYIVFTKIIWLGSLFWAAQEKKN